MIIGPSVCVYLTTAVWEIFAYKNFRVKNFSDIVYLSKKFLKRNFKTSVLSIVQCDCIKAVTKRECAHHHGRVRKTLLYSRLSHLSGSMDSSTHGLFFSTHFLYGPRFLLLSVVTFTTSQLARAIACNGIDNDKGPLGLGRPSFGLK